MVVVVVVVVVVVAAVVFVCSFVPCCCCCCCLRLQLSGAAAEHSVCGEFHTTVVCHESMRPL